MIDQFQKYKTDIRWLMEHKIEGKRIVWRPKTMLDGVINDLRRLVSRTNGRWQRNESWWGKAIRNLRLELSYDVHDDARTIIIYIKIIFHIHTSKKVLHHLGSASSGTFTHKCNRDPHKQHFSSFFCSWKSHIAWCTIIQIDFQKLWSDCNTHQYL